MLPIPRRSAWWVFIALVLLLAIGIASRSAQVIGLANAGFIGLVLCFAATLPLGRRVRQERLEFAWWAGHEADALGGTVTPGAPFDVRCYLRNRSAIDLILTRIAPIVPVEVSASLEEGAELRVGANSRSEFTISLIAPATGRVVLHGLSMTLHGPLGLFETPLYFPNPLAIKVLPRAAARRRSRARVVSGTPVARSGQNLLRRRGGGTELHELRELVPGDPFKSIAWKASARTGRLMVKEVEREVQETCWLVVDVSGSLRAGRPGERKLDYVIEAVAAEARRAIDDGDRVGIVTVDGRVLAIANPADGARQMLRVYDALLATTEIVDADLTEAGADDVARIVTDYIRQQDGLDFHRKSQPTEVDTSALASHLRRVMGAGRAPDVLHAESPEDSIFRAFCRVRGIPLAHRPSPREGQKGPALAGAIRLAGGRGRAPAQLIIFSDLDDVDESEALESSLKFVRAHGHGVRFVIPDARSFAPAPSSPLERDLYRIYGLAEERRLLETKRRLGALGLSVHIASREASSAGRRLAALDERAA